ncbi:hypothetical protein HPG69_007490 [Diceros bicornis minor]|uniref:KRAB domain-containing protein n=1 Tax=Diceros bicornis minor TaxID=77932 RepID=A0A7J7F757_DICBM|nr:hypothetical protein HPG69_007490 [Diceros bicornis minor]
MYISGRSGYDRIQPGKGPNRAFGAMTRREACGEEGLKCRRAKVIVSGSSKAPLAAVSFLFYPDVGLLSFKDISLEFTWEEWQLLDSMQKYLYRNVILENYSNLLSVGYCGSKPDLIFKLEQGEEPCIINASISPQSCAAPSFSVCLPMGVDRIGHPGLQRVSPSSHLVRLVPLLPLRLLSLLPSSEGWKEWYQKNQDELESVERSYACNAFGKLHLSKTHVSSRQRLHKWDLFSPQYEIVLLLVYTKNLVAPDVLVPITRSCAGGHPRVSRQPAFLGRRRAAEPSGKCSSAAPSSRAGAWPLARSGCAPFLCPSPPRERRVRACSCARTPAPLRPRRGPADGGGEGGPGAGRRRVWGRRGGSRGPRPCASGGGGLGVGAGASAGSGKLSGRRLGACGGGPRGGI